MRLAVDLREAIYLSALNGSLSERRPGEKTEQFHSSFTDEEPFSIPDSWKWCYFSDVVTIATNLVDPKDYQDYLQIAPDYIEKGTGILKPCNTVRANKIISKNHLFRAGQIIYSKIRPALRKAVIAPFDGLCSADMYPLETELDTHYLLFFLLSDFFTKKAVEKSAREKMPKINQKELGKLPIPIPPVEEQQRIVERVKELLPEINEYEEMEKQLIALKETFPRNLSEAILFSAIQGKLTRQDHSDEPVAIQSKRLADRKAASGSVSKKDRLPMIQPTFDIPDGWTWTTLSELGTLSGGKTPSMHDAENWSSPDVNWFTSKDMKQKYLSESMMKISLKASEELQLFPCGTLLMVVRSGILKHTLPLCILTQEATINQDLKAFTLFDNEMSEYVYWMLKGLQPVIIKRYTKHVTTVDSLRMDAFFYQMPVPLPPIEEQQRIVDRLNTILPMCDALVEET